MGIEYIMVWHVKSIWTGRLAKNYDNNPYTRWCGDGGGEVCVYVCSQNRQVKVMSEKEVKTNEISRKYITGTEAREKGRDRKITLSFLS